MDSRLGTSHVVDVDRLGGCSVSNLVAPRCWFTGESDLRPGDVDVGVGDTAFDNVVSGSDSALDIAGKVLVDDPAHRIDDAEICWVEETGDDPTSTDPSNTPSFCIVTRLEPEVPLHPHFQSSIVISDRCRLAMRRSRAAYMVSRSFRSTPGIHETKYPSFLPVIFELWVS